jgi:protoheme ferro-lyase
MNVHELYEQTIKSLPAADRLHLAVLILNDIPPQSVVDDSESWAEEDLQEFTQASWQHIDQHLEDEAYG